MATRRTGDWARGRRIFGNLAQTTERAADTAVLQEAHHLRGKMVEGITDQAPGGKAFKPLSPLTLAARRLRRFRGTKALMVRGDLRNQITVMRVGRRVFVGVLKTATGRDGKKLINIANVHEFGYGPIIIKVTPKMRRWLAVLYKEAGIPRVAGAGSGRGVVVIRIPARPFIRPVYERDAKPADVKARLEERTMKILNKEWA
jgi:hypothetical protein